MHPPFQSIGSAAGFAGTLAALLVLPLVIHKVGNPPRGQAYRAMKIDQGLVGRSIVGMEQDTDADVVIVGASQPAYAVDVAQLQKELEPLLHRPVKVRMLALFVTGIDSEYFMLRTLYDNAKGHYPKLVLFSNPHPDEKSEQPHKNQYLWLRYGEYPDIIGQLSAKDKAETYAEFVFGAPRQLLTMARPNLLGDDEADATRQTERMEKALHVGFEGKKFVPTPPPPDFKPIPLTTVSAPECQPTSSLGHFSKIFLKNMVDLAKSHGSKVAVLNITRGDEIGKPFIPIVAPWPELLGPQGAMIGAAPTQMFAGLTKEQEQAYFGDGIHFNANGLTLFTQAIAPAIATLLQTEGN